MNCEANKCIACTVTSCKHHCDAQDYCSLSKIQVSTHECNPTMDQCTDCQSFAKRYPTNARACVALAFVG